MSNSVASCGHCATPNENAGHALSTPSARADAVEQRGHEVGFGVRQDHRELVAADAARVVAEAQRAAEALAEIAQRRVAGLVAVLVVDVLEVVEVEQHERERPAVPRAARDRHLEQAVEAAPVVQTGERVVPRVVAQHVEAQRQHAQRQHHRAVEAVVVERGPV